VGLSAIRAATARVGRFSLLAVLVYVADENTPAVAGTGAPAALGREHTDGQDVFAVLPAAQEVGTVAGLFAVVDRVEAPARYGRDSGGRTAAHVVA
jgi:hypothetical protein